MGLVSCCCNRSLKAQKYEKQSNTKKYDRDALIEDLLLDKNNKNSVKFSRRSRLLPPVEDDDIENQLQERVKSAADYLGAAYAELEE